MKNMSVKRVVRIPLALYAYGCAKNVLNRFVNKDSLEKCQDLSHAYKHLVLI
jgi:hypothetical protein